jgi:hypothetical protein
MTRSGDHDNDAWNYMQAACKELPGITIDAAYYFHVRCKEYPNINAEFQVFIDQEIKGSSEDIGPGLAGSVHSSITNTSKGSSSQSKGKRRNSSDRMIEEFQEFKRLTTEQGTNRKKMVVAQEAIAEAQSSIKSAVLLEKKMEYASKKLEEAKKNGDVAAIDKYEKLAAEYEEQFMQLS